MEILIRSKDKPGRVGGLKANDVVTVQPDGHVWSDFEKSNPEWRIIKVPGYNNQSVIDQLMLFDSQGNRRNKFTSSSADARLVEFMGDDIQGREPKSISSNQLSRAFRLRGGAV